MTVMLYIYSPSINICVYINKINKINICVQNNGIFFHIYQNCRKIIVATFKCKLLLGSQQSKHQGNV